MTKHNSPARPTATVYTLPNIGTVVNVKTGTYTFIGRLNGWTAAGHYPTSIHTIEVYKVNRDGIEMFTGFASDKVKALLIPAMLTAAEECRSTGKYQAA